MFRSFITIFYWLLASGGVIALKLMSLDVPTAIMLGESVWLNCTLDLESDELYSVKWYKDDVEFYRHLPQDNPSGQKYDVPGIYLDLRKSVQGHVFLTKTDLESEGIYRCEASAESPTFQTVEAEKQMKVYVLPQQDPVIEGSQLRYEVGDYVNVTCKSGYSKPAAVLKWYVNGIKMEKDVEIHYPNIEHPNGLQTSILGLLFMVKPNHLFQGGAITLRCIATFSQTYSTSSEELIVGEKYSGISAAMNTLTVVAKDGPLITGGETQYRVGEFLNLNCSSTKSKPVPTLNWYLNDRLITNESVVHYPPLIHEDGEGRSVLGLRLRVQRSHLDENEEVRLKCTSTMSRVINVRSDERTFGGNHRNSGLQVAENYGKERNAAAHIASVNGSFKFAFFLILVVFL
ncbi:muscle M-line assembly protein unc-89 isoform X2 [Parasteatoda tepidariorum]|uniref:muscle M-line assembly protein unc-89 isoform X2 n=1 Tax=Parasteatoda tepidariorum TaxID=114398 RepID=UPI0039BD1319